MAKIIAILEVDETTLVATGNDFETEMAWVASSGIELEEFAVIPEGIDEAIWNEIGKKITQQSAGKEE